MPSVDNDDDLGQRLMKSIEQNDIESVVCIVRDRQDMLQFPMRYADRGGPLSYAAQLGHLALVQRLIELGSSDLQQALSRACMRAHRDVAQYLVEQGADPNGLYSDTATHYGPVILATCEALNPEGLRLILDLGADPDTRYRTPEGKLHTPLGFLLGGYGRAPMRKHACLEVLYQAGVPCDDTPIMAFHRGRIDLLEEHLQEDSLLVHRRFHEHEFFRPEIGFDEASVFAPLEGVTLLHLAIEYDEFTVADWLISHGADVNARAGTDTDGYGAHTPLFHAALGCSPIDRRVKFLLERGADPTVRATFRHPKYGWSELAGKVFDSVTPLEYALAFQDAPDWLHRESIHHLAK